MSDKVLKQILEKLNQHEKRIGAIERRDLVAMKGKELSATEEKNLTLPEFIRNKSFKNGQEKIAVIVWYYEKILQEKSIKEVNLKEGWRVGKFDGKYNPNLLIRAIKDGLVRNINGDIDLSQTGEKFLEDFLRQNDRDS